MNLRRALANLACINVTRPVLTAEGVDPHNPAAVRHLVEELLRAALGPHRVASAMQIARLQSALGYLITDCDATAGITASSRIADIRAAANPTPASTPAGTPVGTVDDPAGLACLADA